LSACLLADGVMPAALAVGSRGACLTIFGDRQHAKAVGGFADCSWVFEWQVL